jgi:hypothetical protein
LLKVALNTKIQIQIQNSVIFFPVNANWNKSDIDCKWLDLISHIFVPIPKLARTWNFNVIYWWIVDHYCLNFIFCIYGLYIWVAYDISW